MKKFISLLIMFSAISLAQDKKFFGDVETDSTLTFRLVKTGIVSQDFSTNETINWSQGSWFRDTLSAGTNPDLNFSNAVDGQWITVEIYSVGINSINWDETIMWLGTTPPSSVTEDKTDIFQFAKSGTNYLGMIMTGFK